MKFPAAILVAQKQELVVDEIEIPDEEILRKATPGVGQVLVEVAYSGVCGAQLGEQDGIKGPDDYCPHLLGHEGSGKVVAVGLGVRGVVKGDHVVMHWRVGSGIQSRPPVYKWGGKTVGGGWVTTFNRYAVVSENRITAIPKDIPLDIAALMGCAVTTGLGAVTRVAQAHLGESIVIVGAGGVGTNVIQAAALAGAYPIVAVDVVPARLTSALQFGASYVVSSVEAVREILPRGADIVIETTGLNTVIEAAYHIVAESGRMILIGHTRFDHKVHLHPSVMFNGRSILASQGGSTEPTLDIPRYLKLWRAGRLLLAPLIACRTRLVDINDTFAAIRAGEITGRVLIDMSME
jgi:S-(hydroxymethyl)glutathione dehydrogenase/alcohol dehydrogenase